MPACRYVKENCPTKRTYVVQKNVLKKIDSCLYESMIGDKKLFEITFLNRSDNVTLCVVR